MKIFNIAFVLKLTLSIITIISLFSCNYIIIRNNKIKLNQIQVIGSHNSYKKKIQPEIMNLIKTESSSWATSLEYHHISLENQLDLGLRNLELDVVYDPQGKRFSHPFANKILNDKGIQVLPYDSAHEMDNPGFKVLHIPDLDFRTWHYTLKSALIALRKWSDAHPDHIPIFITMNAKSENINKPGFATVLPFNKEVFDSLDIEIFKWLTPSKLITPEMIIGKYKTLNEAILHNNWPELNSVRGKFMFILDETGVKQSAYLQDHLSLKGRAMFVNANPGTSASAFIIMNEPIQSADSITKLVKLGYIVRTRADADTKEARENDYKRMNAAISSGAQIITTDYYLPDTSFNTNYHVILPNNKTVRYNPVLLKNSLNSSFSKF